MTQNNILAAMLHCNSVTIPSEYEKAVKHFAAGYVSVYSLSGFYNMDYDIVYNRTCNLVLHHIKNTPGFSPDSFKDIMSFKTLFYNLSDIHTLIEEYKKDPNAAIPYIICFFSRKIYTFKKSHIVFASRLEPEELDSVLLITVCNTLKNCNSSTSFSFTYLDLELFAALTEQCGHTHPFALNRKDYVNYQKLSYLIQKYHLTREQLPGFLREINTSFDELPQSRRAFPIEDIDIRYSCKISIKKAFDFYSLHIIEQSGFLPDSTYDEEADMIHDHTGPVYEKGYSDAELALFAAQVLTNPKAKRIFERLTQPYGAVFTNQELATDFNCSRYELTNIKKEIFKKLL